MSERKALLTGGCQCGAVRFAFYAPPGRIGVCYCRMCQKAVSGPFATFVESSLENFAWTRGTPTAFRSSSIAERDFCAACGSPLTYRKTGGTKIELLTGTFDEPEKVVPTYAVGLEGRLGWIATVNDLPSTTTIQNIGAEKAASIVSNQHPDHNT